MTTCDIREKLRKDRLTIAGKTSTIVRERQVIAMRFEDIAQCKVGTVLQHTVSKRPAVLVGIFGPPLKSISVQYLVPDHERIEGCNLETLEPALLRAGIYLHECRTGKEGRLMDDSSGPEIKIWFQKTGEKKRQKLCELEGKRVRAAFWIVPAPTPKGTEARETPP